MSIQQANEVQRLLKQAGEAAVPLKDPGLTRKINEASDHITKRIDPVAPPKKP